MITFEARKSFDEFQWCPNHLVGGGRFARLSGLNHSARNLCNNGRSFLRQHHIGPHLDPYHEGSTILISSDSEFPNSFGLNWHIGRLKSR